MRFSRWLNSLTFSDQITIFFLGILSCFLSFMIIKLGINRYNEYRKDQPFAPDIQISPFGFFSVAIPVMFFLYLLIGEKMSLLIEKFWN